MSLQSLLSIARSALFAHQRAIEVTGHNIANAQTPGYSRQRLELVQAVPTRTPQGYLGRGVEIGEFMRLRNTLLDGGYRRNSGSLGFSGQMAGSLGALEGALGAAGSSGIGESMQEMFTAFGELANDPANVTNRTQVLNAASRFVNELRRVDAAISGLEEEARSAATGGVQQVNDLTRRIAALNAQIGAAGPAGSAPDLMDQRDRLIDELSQLVSVRVIERTDGTIGILAGSTTLVDNASARTLEVRGNGSGGWQIGLVGGAAVDVGGGTLKAAETLANTTYPAVRAKLDELVRAVVTETNAIHQNGYTQNGAVGVDFFDGAGLTAGTIELSATVSGNPSMIAASSSGAGGDGAIALQLAGLHNLSLTAFGGRSMRGMYGTLVSDVAMQVRGASDDVATWDTLVTQADVRRQSESGVSVDEEMVLLVGQQRAYQAAARLVNVADEMIQSVLDMV
ncbi:MAG: flagellar hook-associated protein FlgK [Candidatus Eisenbacteria bacterium]|uniref:Flagellar hook-associated protein 1 n=1 Tax=Eiseniibacteriota bacterium TaxID=2212470 RepID=A0A849SIA7_UNCEI|nr:flagellar hook-associated protein FlgK [Candidatus Eisenbacteria bacterium]